MFNNQIAHLVFTIIITIITPHIKSHIRLTEPSQRSSLWRNAEYAKFNPKINPYDDQLWCDYVLQPRVPIDCGICGDPFTDPVPRPNEHGGIYGQGVISRNYTSGEDIKISAFVRIPHNGSFHIQLCDQYPETNDCFMDKPHLEIRSRKGTFKDYPVVGTSNTPYWINGSVRLPPGVACDKCVLRLNYRAGYLGQCDDGSEDYGCGLQITFRNCMDISISPKVIDDDNNYQNNTIPDDGMRQSSKAVRVTANYQCIMPLCILCNIIFYLKVNSVAWI